MKYRRTRCRKALAVVTAAGLAAGMSLCVAGTASAAPNPRNCESQGDISFSPGLHTAAGTTINVSGSGRLIACQDLGVLTGLTADYTLTGSGNASCLTQNFTATETIHWNNGNTSVVSMSSVIGALGTIAFAGSVTSGELANNPVAFPITVTPGDLTNFVLACASPGGATQAATLGDEIFLAQ
jgi:hypothetical protein